MGMTRDEAEPGGEAETTTPALVAFRVGGIDFAVDASGATKVTAVPDLTPLPRAPAHVPALVLLGARALPILDLAVFFGLAETEDAADLVERLVVLKSGPWEAGVIARGIAVIDAESIREARRSLEPIGTGQVEAFTLAQIDYKDRLLSMLDLPRLLEAARVVGDA